MIAYADTKETVAIVDRMLAALMTGMPMVGEAGSDLRRLVGKLRADAGASIAGGTIGSELQVIFDTALAAGATLGNMDNVRAAMLNEAPLYYAGAAVACSGIIFSLVEQTRMITKMTFASRADVDALMDKMGAVFDTVKLALSNTITGDNYQYLVELGAALIQHLAATERLLPRLLSYQMVRNLPALTVANVLYGDGARFDELIRENKTVHPAFMQRDLVALSE